MMWQRPELGSAQRLIIIGWASKASGLTRGLLKSRLSRLGQLRAGTFQLTKLASNVGVSTIDGSTCGIQLVLWCRQAVL